MHRGFKQRRLQPRRRRPCHRVIQHRTQPRQRQGQLRRWRRRQPLQVTLEGVSFAGFVEGRKQLVAQGLRIRRQHERRLALAGADLVDQRARSGFDVVVVDGDDVAEQRQQRGLHRRRQRHDPLFASDAVGEAQQQPRGAAYAGSDDAFVAVADVCLIERCKRAGLWAVGELAGLTTQVQQCVENHGGVAVVYAAFVAFVVSGAGNVADKLCKLAFAEPCGLKLLEGWPITLGAVEGRKEDRAGEKFGAGNAAVFRDERAVPQIAQAVHDGVVDVFEVFGAGDVQ